MATRGLRNNNPGNLRRTNDNWIGLADRQADPEFFQFSEPKFGIRAMTRVLDTYRERGTDTVQEIISRWAPPNENDTQEYVQFVSEKTGMSPGRRVRTGTDRLNLIKAIIAKENGSQPFTDEEIRKGMALANVQDRATPTGRRHQDFSTTPEPVTERPEDFSVRLTEAMPVSAARVFAGTKWLASITERPLPEVARGFAQDTQELAENPQEKLAEYQGERAQGATEELNLLATETSDTETLADFAEEERELITDPVLGPAYSVLRQEYPDMPMEDLEQQAALMTMFKDLAEVAQKGEDQGLIDKILDYGGLLVSDQSIDLELQADLDESLVGAFQFLSPRSRVVAFRALRDTLMESQDQNELKVANTLSKFLSATGAQELETELDLDKLFLALDVAGVGGPALVKGVAKAFRAAGPIRAAKRGGNTGAAGGGNAVAMGSDEAAESLGTTREAAVENALPFRREEDVGPTHVDGIHNESMAAIAERTEDTTEEVERIMRDGLSEDFSLQVLGRELFDTEKIADAFKQRVEEFSARLTDEYEDTAKTFGEVEIVPLDANNLKYRIEVPVLVKEKDAAGRLTGRTVEVTRETTEFSPTVNEIGQYEIRSLAERGEGVRALASGKVLAQDKTRPGRTVGNIIENAEIIDTQKAKLRQTFGDAYRAAIRPLTTRTGNLKSRQFQEVERVLQHGDEIGDSGKRFTESELKAGVTLENGEVITLNDAQISTYFNMLTISDVANLYRKRIAREQLALQGFKQLDILDGHVYAKPVERVPDGVKRVFDTTQNKSISVGEATRRVEDPDNVLVNVGERLPLGRQTDRERLYQHIIVPRTTLRELPEDVLIDSREAYIPKINYEARAAVKRISPAQIDGVLVQEGMARTQRLFAAPREARRHADDLNAGRTEEEIERGVKYVATDDFEVDPTAGVIEGREIPAGSLFKARSMNDIPFGIRAEKTERLPAGEALQRHLNMIANRYPANEWRIAEQARFRETVNSTEGVRRIQSFDDPIVATSAEGAEAARKLQNQQQVLRSLLETPTTDETAWMNMQRRVADFITDRPLFDRNIELPFKDKPVNLRKSVLSLADKDPIAAMRSAAFHALLGFYNPAQFFVQLSGASIAATAFPRQGVKAFRDTIAMRAAMFTSNLDTRRRIAKAAGLDTDEFLETVEAFNRTGLKEALLNTADYRASMQGFGHSGITFRNFARKGLVPFQEGELWARMVAWNAARRNWKEANPGKALDATAQKEIFSDMQNLTLNVSRVNRAFWQDGFLSIPTQFQQIRAKFIETLGPALVGQPSSRGLSTAQGWRVFMGHAALYGSAGVPFGLAIKRWIEQESGVGIDDLPDQVWSALDQGFFGWITGGNIEISTRFSLAAGFERMLTDGVLSEEANMREILLGPFGEIVGRTTDGFQAVRMLASRPSEIDATTFAAAVSNVAGVASSFRNAETGLYYMMALDRYQTNTGLRISRDFSAFESLSKAIGFSLTENRELFRFMQDEQKRKEVLSEVTDRIMKQTQVFLKFRDRDPDRAAEAFHQAQIELAAIEDLNPSDRRTIMRNIARRLSDPQTLEDRAINDAFRRLAEGVENDIQAQRMIKRLVEEAED